MFQWYQLFFFFFFWESNGINCWSHYFNGIVVHTCHHCGIVDHIRSNCSFCRQEPKDVTKSSNKKPRCPKFNHVCYHCGVVGHIFSRNIFPCYKVFTSSTNIFRLSLNLIVVIFILYYFIHIWFNFGLNLVIMIWINLVKFGSSNREGLKSKPIFFS